jgi:hypothetical protein
VASVNLGYSIQASGSSMATTTGLMYSAIYPVYRFQLMEEPKKRKESNEMTLFKVYVVDILHGVVTSEHTRIGRDEGDAGIGLKLTEAEEKLKAKDALEIIWNNVGAFQKIVRTRTIVEKDEE